MTKQGLRVLVCAGTGCVANGSLKVIEKFKELGADVSVLTDYDKMTIVPTGCHGFCEQGGLVVIPDKHLTYVKMWKKFMKATLKITNLWKDYYMLILKLTNMF